MGTSASARHKPAILFLIIAPYKYSYLLTYLYRGCTSRGGDYTTVPCYTYGGRTALEGAIAQ